MAWFGGLNNWFQETFTVPAPAPPPETSLPESGSNTGGYPTGAYGGASASTSAPRGGDDRGQRRSLRLEVQPTPVDKGAAATEVAALAQEKLSKAWTAFESEFVVQQRVWDSCSLTFKSTASEADRKKRQSLQFSIDSALKASKTDPRGAVQMLRPVLQGSQSNKDDVVHGLNSATETAAQNVIKAERQSQHCQKLAAMLKANDASRSQQEDLETLVNACQLSNSGLESRIRQALGMAKSKQEQKREAKEALDMEKKAMKALIGQLAEAAGTSRDCAKRALDNAGGEPDLALVMLLSDPDEIAQREKRMPSKSKEELKQEKREKAIKDAEQQKKEKLAEAKKLVHAITSLASSTQRMAWAQVQIELETQVNVWQSQALLATSVGGFSPDYWDTQTEIQGVLTEAAQDPANAVFLLEVALQQAVDRGLDLGTGILVSADGVLDAESVARSRRTLATRLQDELRAMETGREVLSRKWPPKETAELIGACKLKDSTMAARAQMMLEPRNVSL